MRLADLTWPEVQALNFDRLIVLLPTGSFEQHGHHLPFTTDTDIVTAIAERLEQRFPESVLLVPTLWPGLSTHHMHFPGTMDVVHPAWLRLPSVTAVMVASLRSRPSACWLMVANAQ